MRSFIFILMIALLPLRGWMGEAMATEMATMHLIAAHTKNTSTSATFYTKKVISIPVDKVSSAMPADCEMHAKAALDVASAGTADASTPLHTCDVCQSFHAAGLVYALPNISAIPTHTPAPDAPVSLYASAKLALSQKPPIL